MSRPPLPNPPEGRLNTGSAPASQDARVPCRRNRHVWKVVSDVREKSPIEMVAGTGRGFTQAAPWIFEASHVVTRECERCGTQEVARV